MIKFQFYFKFINSIKIQSHAVLYMYIRGACSPISQYVFAINEYNTKRSPHFVHVYIFRTLRQADRRYIGPVSPCLLEELTAMDIFGNPSFELFVVL